MEKLFTGSEEQNLDLALLMKSVKNGAVSYCLKNCVDASRSEVTVSEKKCYDTCKNTYYELSGSYLVHNFSKKVEDENKNKI